MDNAKRLAELVTRYCPYWGEILYTIDNWDDSKTELENVLETSKAFGYRDTTGVSCSDSIHKALYKVSGGTIRSIKELRGLM